MKRPSNALALAVLAVLYERPMHPYEISSTLRFRRKEDSIKINYGSLYAVVESLEKKNLIEASERIRDGKRPERTIYALTPAGEEALREWLSELIALPTRQFTDFEAALSLMPALPPETVRDLLAQRLQALEQEPAAMEVPVPRLFSIEEEYRVALRNAEIAFVRALLADIDQDVFDGLPLWRRVHELKREGVGDDLVARLSQEYGLPQQE